jgi:predicted RND superfamily exporter protein
MTTNPDTIDIIMRCIVLATGVVIFGFLILMVIFAILISIDEVKKMKQRKFDSKTNETIEYKFKESEDSNNE